MNKRRVFEIIYGQIFKGINSFSIFLLGWKIYIKLDIDTHVVFTQFEREG